MDPFRPHYPRPTFEGYYSKFDLPSGGHIALVICSVPKASRRPHMVSFTYVPPEFPDIPVFQREIWVTNIEMTDVFDSLSDGANSRKTKANDRSSFRLSALGVGEMVVKSDSTTTYTIRDPNHTFTFTAIVQGSTRVPWFRNKLGSTPENLLIYLPLPLHWHVHSLESECTFQLHISPEVYNHMNAADLSDNLLPAKVHQEKNWAHSFPSSHIWIQCRNPKSNTGLNIAGGSIIGMEAYLLAYHAEDPANDVSFTPPWSMTPSILPRLSPTMSAIHSWTDRSVMLSIANMTRKIEVFAHAAPGTFFGLSAPFNDGHRHNFLGQSFRATVKVKVYRASLWGFGHWNLVCEEIFEGASLEFGGDAYEDKHKGHNSMENDYAAWIS